MNKEKFKKEFVNELLFFSSIANRDKKRGYSDEQVEDGLIRYTATFYGVRQNYDAYAIKKSYFIATYVKEIIKGKSILNEIDRLYKEIEEEENKIGVEKR